LHTKQLTISQGARIGADNNQGDAGSLTIQAERIDLIGTSPKDPFPSAITAFGTRQGGNLTLHTQALNVREGAGISVQSLGTGNAGNLAIAADTILLDDRALLTATSAVGQGGNIQIDSRSLTVLNGSTISAATSAQGDAGNIRVNSRDAVTIMGDGSGLFTTTNGTTGRGGAISITSDRFTITDNAQLNAITTSSQPGGTITINSRLFNAESGGRLRTSTLGAGQAGDIQVNATERATLQGIGVAEPTISLLQNAIIMGELDFIPPSSNSLQDSALVIRRPEEVFRIVVQDLPKLSENQTGLFASSYGSGSGGSVELNAPDIKIANQALVSVSAWATGNGGTLKLAGDQVRIQDSLLFSSTTAGNGGNLTISATNLTLSNSGLIAATAGGKGATLDLNIRDTLLLRQNSQITARAFATGNGGNININAKFVVAVPSENNDITARAVQGQGGNIRIITQGIYGLKFRPQLTPKSDITASSQFGLDGLVTITTPNLDPNRGVLSLPLELADATRQVVQTCEAQAATNRFVITGRGGLPPTAQEVVNAALGWQGKAEGGGRKAEGGGAAEGGRQRMEGGRNQPFNAQHSTLNIDREAEREETTIVEATGWIVRSDGTVVLIADSEAHYPQAGFLPISCLLQPAVYE
jgi:large exoprotein involved in heme utilization and adhesion